MGRTPGRAGPLDPLFSSLSDTPTQSKPTPARSRWPWLPGVLTPGGNSNLADDGDVHQFVAWRGILYSGNGGATQFRMPNELDPKIADGLVITAVSSVHSLPNEKIICTRRRLKEAVLAAVQEAYELGFLAGQEMRLRERVAPGSLDRPPWMDIRLDDMAGMAVHGLRFRPIVLKSLLGAGNQCLGDLRWMAIERLIGLFYIGRKTAKQIGAVVERLERSGEVPNKTAKQIRAVVERLERSGECTES